MRLPRPRIENCCVHVTHRCQQRLFPLGTDVDWRQYVKRLWEASRRFPAVRVLDYVITANHIHLLAFVRLVGAAHGGSLGDDGPAARGHMPATATGAPAGRARSGGAASTRPWSRRGPT